MAILQAGSILRQLRRAAFDADGAGLTDGQLLRSFLSRRDEAAFEALVRRHGPMVRGVCRRVLRNPHDADDAFQAAFLVLVRKANGLAAREVVGDWLHGVAYRVALKARTAEALRRVKERQAHRHETQENEGRPEWLALLDREVSRLPEKYRLPVVLCDLEGRTRKEVARQLGWPEGTVAGRLARARALLARRLTRQGVTLSAAALASALTGEAVASVPITLARSTSRAAIEFAAGQTVGAISVQVATLTEGVVKAMLFAKMKPTCMLVMVVLAVTIGVGAWHHAATAGQADSGQQEEALSDARVRPTPPATLAAHCSFQIDLTLTRVKEGERRLLAVPRMLAQEGMEASYSNGVPHEFPVSRDKLETVIMGPTIRAVVRRDEGNKVYLNLIVSQPTRGLFAVEDVTVETKSVRILRKIELGQAVTAKLKTGDNDSTFLEVTAMVQEEKENVHGNSLQEAERDLRTAEFWLRTDHRDSASYYFNLIRQKYPDTIYSERAKKRLDELKKQQSKRAEVEEEPLSGPGQVFILDNARSGKNKISKQASPFPGQVLTYPDRKTALLPDTDRCPNPRSTTPPSRGRSE